MIALIPVASHAAEHFVSSDDDIRDFLGSNVAREVLQTVSSIDYFHSDTPLAYERFDVPMARREHGLHAEKDLAVELSTFLEVGAGERLVHQALVSLLYGTGQVKPLDR